MDKKERSSGEGGENDKATRAGTGVQGEKEDDIPYVEIRSPTNKEGARPLERTSKKEGKVLRVLLRTAPV